MSNEDGGLSSEDLLRQARQALSPNEDLDSAKPLEALRDPGAFDPPVAPSSLGSESLIQPLIPTVADTPPSVPAAPPQPPAAHMPPSVPAAPPQSPAAHMPPSVPAAPPVGMPPSVPAVPPQPPAAGMAPSVPQAPPRPSYVAPPVAPPPMAPPRGPAPGLPPMAPPSMAPPPGAAAASGMAPPQPPPNIPQQGAMPRPQQQYKPASRWNKIPWGPVIGVAVVGIFLLIGFFAGRGVTDVDDLSVGDCFEDPGLSDFDKVTDQDCALPHDIQIVGRVTTGIVSPLPESSLNSLGQTCEDVFFDVLLEEGVIEGLPDDWTTGEIGETDASFGSTSWCIVESPSGQLAGSLLPER